MNDDYLKAKRTGDRSFRKAVLAGQDPYLPALEDILPQTQRKFQMDLGIKEIPTDLVIGTYDRGRQSAFACDFMPILGSDSEFAMKWSAVCHHQQEEGISDPVLVYEYKHRFYVQEGNKRVSVLKYHEVAEIAAHVIRIIPEEEDPFYEEFLDYYRKTGLYLPDFSKRNSYRRLLKLLDRDGDQVWQEADTRSLKAAYYLFEDLYRKKGLDSCGLGSGDAFLIYLSAYDVERLYAADAEKDVLALSREFRAAAEENKISTAEENDVHGLRKILPLHADELRVAFLYESDPQLSSRVFDHEVGRILLESRDRLGVRTDRYENCLGEKLIESLTDAIRDHDVIITTSPLQFGDTFRFALQQPDKIFLNCSAYPGRNALRTYSLRMYEAQFLLGVLAGALCDDHKLAYIADYPFYGTIAAINAFAIGASMSDPQVRVFLGWSETLDKEWQEQMKILGIRVFSGPDLPDFHDDNTEYGLYRFDEEGNVINLATPVVHWERYYEKLMKMIADKNYVNAQNRNKAVSYRWGMSNDVLDISISDSVAYSLRKMIGMLKGAMIKEMLDPFEGELHDNEGHIWNGSSLSSEDVYGMNWLNENILGVIPSADQLKEDIRDITEESGIGR